MKAVFTVKPESGYDDAIEFRYHFPRTYLNQVNQTVGDFIVYYEPRRISTQLSSIGGRQSYFAVACVESVEADFQREGLYYARLSAYIDFDFVVPFSLCHEYFEAALRKEDGSTNRGAFGRAVRLISDDEFNSILRAGFAESLDAGGAKESAPSPGFHDPAVTFERPVVELTTHRKFRDRVFARRVRSAYDLRCAFTGLRILNGGGRPEVQAAHIRPVSENGPDSVRNGLALSSTMHWMFDRGLISIKDDYRIVTAKNVIPDEIRSLINPTMMINLPSDDNLRPHLEFIRFHRQNIFKGAA